MSKALSALLERKQKAVSAAQAITNAAANDGARDLTADELQAINGHLADAESLDAQIATQRRVDDAMRSIAPVGSLADLPAATVVLGTVDNREATHGFNGFGDFLFAVRNAGMQGGRTDERLGYGAAAPGTYGNENVGLDGGFAVPMEYATEIVSHALAEDSFLSMCDDNPVSGNSMTFPSDETTPWGSDGVRAYWEGEADTATGTKPKIKPNLMRLSKLFGLVPLTDELVEDAATLPSYVNGKLAESIRWKTNDAIVNGTGAGQPMGFGSSANGALVTITKESGQAASTFVAANAAKMFARMPAGYLRDAVWMVNPEILPQLLTMVIGNQPIWTPPNAGMKDAPGGLLLGKPIIQTQACQALSSKGDVYFVNLRQYRTITKRGAGIQLAQSMHLYFDAGLTAFRATFRVDGQPKFKSSITPAKGSAALSPYVTLEAR